jgi:hypothetical protein
VEENIMDKKISFNLRTLARVSKSEVRLTVTPRGKCFLVYGNSRPWLFSRELEPTIVGRPRAKHV